MKSVQKRKAKFILIIFCWLITGFYPLGFLHAEEKKIPESHAVLLIDKPRCTECHTDDTGVAMKPVATFTHNTDWMMTHKFYSSQASELCSSCHSFSFCSDCHAYKSKGLKPSQRYSGSTGRWLPHRGNYLFQHRIDGRVDPTGCFRCHGRQNNRVCKRCHR